MTVNCGSCCEIRYLPGVLPRWILAQIYSDFGPVSGG
jgi:hypothetical protein